jgi:hypothetical protein
LRDLKPVDQDKWKVSMRISKSDDSFTRDQENKQYEMEFRSDYEEYKRRVNSYINNLIKAHAMIWERCTKGMKQKIEARTDFHSKIEDNPIKLLKVIKEHTQNFLEHRYCMSIVLDSLGGLLNTKQKEGESLQDWTKRFRTSMEILECHFGGPLIIKKIIGSLSEYNASDEKSVKICEEKILESFLAFLHLENADRTKNGSLSTGLNTQQLLGNNQYPKSVTEANNVLRNHKLDNSAKFKKENEDTKSKQKFKKEREEAKEQEVTLSFAQTEGKCYCCGKPGH